MEAAVYPLCAATALTCSLLLLRSYRRSRLMLLLWCGLFFLALAMENVILMVDLMLVPEVDLSGFRNSVALAGTMMLMYGLIWEAK